MSDNPIFVYTGSTRSSYGYGTTSGTFAKSFGEAYEHSVFSMVCPYCKLDCESETAQATYGGSGWHEDVFASCARCGWWSYKSDGDSTDGEGNFHSVAALLKEFSAESPDVPLEPLISYIGDNGDLVRSIAPAKLEELVGAIYTELFGYKVEYCSYARPDKGIDLIVVKPDECRPVAIQVKRSKSPIELGCIHQFYGAMVASDQRRGVFLTTGRFRSGARSEATLLSMKSRMEIDLVDGKRLLEFVGIVRSHQRRPAASDHAFWRSHPYFA